MPVMPALLFERGDVFRAGPQGPEPILDRRGRHVDLLDVIDGLAARHRTVYLVDLGALEGSDPQLDYIQEVSRDVQLWVDAGVRDAEQAMDVIVAGAQKAVLSSARVRGPRELRRAWDLTTNLAFEVEIWEGEMTPVDPEWGTTDPAQLAAAARSLGPREMILSFRGARRDWSLLSSISSHGSTWVAGSVEPADAFEIARSGAAGVIYPLGDELISQADALGE